MKKKSLSIVIAVLLIISLALTGCTSSNQESSDTGKTEEAPKKPKFLTIGTAGTGGAYYPIGIAMADIITNTLDIQTTAKVTGGAVENNNLAENKEVEIAITQGPMAFAAVNGTDPYNKKCENVRAIFTGLTTGVFHVVVRNDGDINSVADLKGKKVAMGPAGGGVVNVVKDIFSEYGFTIDDIETTYISYSEGIDALKDNNVDAAIVQAASPAPAIKQLAATSSNFKIISLEDEKRSKILEKYPYYSEITLDKDMYGTDSDIKTIYLSNMVVVNKDLSEELVYDITKALFENIDKIKNSHPAAKGFSVEKAVKGIPIELHPGAEKYYKEKGVL